MATKQAAAAPKKESGKTINRKKRNAATRKSLPKYFKVVFLGASRVEFKTILAAWLDGRKKVKEANA